ncbi:MAG: hypothetical protein Q9208_008332, partial [Pyrenodesmia sp. 3 TL-2023]
MALHNQTTTDPRTAVSLQPELSNQALHPPPVFQKSGSPTSLPTEATGLLDALNYLHIHGRLKGYDDASPPDLVSFNIGTCSLEQLYSYSKQRPELDAWFQDQLHYEYTRSSTDAQENPAIIEEVARIEWVGTPRIRHGTPYEGDESEADAAWATSIDESLCPTFILEVAYSQSFEHLQNKALKWVQGSDGSVQWVLGVKIYPQSVPIQAELWLWRAMRRGSGEWQITPALYK